MSSDSLTLMSLPLISPCFTQPLETQATFRIIKKNICSSISMYSCLCNTFGPLLGHRNRYNVHSLFLFARDDVSAITTSALRKYASENKSTLGHGVLRHSLKQGCPTFFSEGHFYI